MISSVSNLPEVQHTPFTRKQSIVLVFFCTVLGAAAQVFMKIGGTQIHGLDLRIFLNLPLMTGYALYACNTLMLMIALRDGELSKLYPIIALTFVWVNVLSVIFFHEQFNLWKLGGIVAIMAGVSVLGAASSK
jgi:multidrug transporter EmrE-like cation transporter